VHSLEDAALSEEDEVDLTLAAGRVVGQGRGRQRFSKRQLAFMSPRLGLLNNLPMVIPFQTRVEVFNRFIQSVHHIISASTSLIAADPTGKSIIPAGPGATGV